MLLDVGLVNFSVSDTCFVKLLALLVNFEEVKETRINLEVKLAFFCFDLEVG